MKIDASRYRQFMLNPDEYRIRELHNLVPDVSDVHTGFAGMMTFGRRRGSAFHDMLDGQLDLHLLATKYGESAVLVASHMYTANQAYSERMQDEVIWREKEFCKVLPGVELGLTVHGKHSIVGRMDTRMKRGSDEFLLDYKTTKARTKADMAHYRDVLMQSPQVGFYMLASGLRKFVFRILWRDSKKVVQISELEVYRAEWELKAFARGVAIIADTIELWQERYGIEQPWPRCISLPTDPDTYSYRPLYQRAIYEGSHACIDGFKARREHLALDVEDEEGETDAS